MKRLPTCRVRRSGVLTCLVLLGLAACDGGAAPLPLAPADALRSHGAAHPALPLQGRLTGAAALSPEGPCELASYPVTATLGLTGTLSHLGRVTWTSTDCTALASFPEISFVGGTGVITAANADELHFTYFGGGEVVEFTEEGFVSAFTGTATITGGTGRFANATGAFEFTGTLRVPASTVEMRVEGSISYDASNRSGR